MGKSRRQFNPEAFPTMARWLSGAGITDVLSSNVATVLSVDFLPGNGPGGTCAQSCSYCYARSGHQSMARARCLQRARADLYRADPAGWARSVKDALGRINDRYGIGIGTAGRPLRMFGAGDVVSADHWRRAAAELSKHSVAYYGYSKVADVDDVRLMFSADADTDPQDLDRARALGRRIVYVRSSTADVPPADAAVVFPYHNRVQSIVRDRRDCFKLRNVHGAGVCYTCGRCMARGRGTSTTTTKGGIR